MNALLKPLACAALLTSAFASTGYAQTTPTTTATYAYSVSLSVTKPKGSAAELALKNKGRTLAVITASAVQPGHSCRRQGQHQRRAQHGPAGLHHQVRRRQV